MCTQESFTGERNRSDRCDVNCQYQFCWKLVVPIKTALTSKVYMLLINDTLILLETD